MAHGGGVKKKVLSDEEGGDGGAKPALFKRSVWHGHINYECARCPYATLDALTMAGHLRVVHGIETWNTATGARTPAEPIILAEEYEVTE